MYLSIIIPSYKPSLYYLEECIKSIANQNYNKHEYEVIIVLNGCNEPWFTLLKKIMEVYLADISYKLIQVNEGGVSNARNIGINNSIGEYLIFIDDDDYVSTNYLQALAEKVTPTTIVLSDVLSFIDGQSGYNNDYYIHKCFRRLKKISYLSLYKSRRLLNAPWGKIIPRNVIKDYKFNISLKNGEDALFLFKISRNVKNIALCSNSATYYRRYRLYSAISKMKKVKFRLLTCKTLFKEYLFIYFQSPFKYNFIFFISRLAALIKTLFKG